MSGEGAIVYGVVAVVGGGALIAARLATGATGMLGDGLAAIGSRSDAAYRNWQIEQDHAARWECAAREVVDRNARLAVLTAHAAGDPAVLATLPAPLVLCGQAVEELRSWVLSADAALDAADRILGDRVRDVTHAVLASCIGPGSAPVTDPSDVAERYAALRRALVDATATVPPAAVGTGDVERVVGRLDAAVPEPARVEILAVAANVLSRHGADQRSQLDELRNRVGRANAEARQRHEEARTAAVYLQALQEATDPATAQLRERLDEVVGGRAALTPALDRDAVAAAEQERARQEAGHVRARTVATLEELGYRVEEDAATYTGRSGALRMVHPSWSEHAVGLVVDGEELRTLVMRTAPREGDDALRTDTEREQQWCTSLDVLRTELAESGLTVEVTRLVNPGERPVPVAAAARRPRPEQEALVVRQRDPR